MRCVDRRFLGVALVLALPAAGCSSAAQQQQQHSQHAFALATRDGLALGFDQERRQFAWLAAPGLHTALDDTGKPGAALGVRLSDVDGTVLIDNTTPVRWARARDQSVRLSRISQFHGLAIDEQWIAHERHIELSAEIAALPGAPGTRAFEACVRVPMDVTGQNARWHHHLHSSEPIEPGGSYQTLLTESVDIGHWSPAGEDGLHLKSDLPINLHGLSLVGNDSFGLAVAVPPDRPAAHYTAYHADAGVLETCFHLGIHAQHRTRPGSVRIALALFHPDEPAWGLRSALAKLISIYPESFRGALPRQTGMTVSGAYNYRLYPDPKALRIGAMWNGIFPENQKTGVKSLVYSWPTGYLDRGMRLSRQKLEQGCKGCDDSMDAHVAACMGIYEDYDLGRSPFSHTCNGLWELSQCQSDSKSAPRTYGPVRLSDGYYLVHPARVVQPSQLVLRLFGQMAIHAPFAASLLRDANGQYRDAMSTAQALMPVGTSPNWMLRGDDMFTCFLNGINPDPGVELEAALEQGMPATPPFTTRNAGELNLEIARRATGVYGTSYLHTSKDQAPALYNGVAVDTVGAYLRPDFNEEMLRVASFPLSYDRKTGRVVALEHLTLTAFLRALRRAVPADAAIGTNGFPISGTLGQEVDFFVRELGRRWRQEPGDSKPRFYDELYDEHEALRLRRVHRARMVAYQRSITFWARFHRSAQEAMQRKQQPEEALLADMERLLPLYTAQGIYVFLDKTGLPGRDSVFTSQQSPEVAMAYQRHLDTVHALTEAGWEPIPYATAYGQTGSPQGLIIERFGNELLTVYNQGEQAVDLVVDMNWAAMGHAHAPARIVDFTTGEPLEHGPVCSTDDNPLGAVEPLPAGRGHWQVCGLRVGSRGVRVLRIESRTARL